MQHDHVLKKFNFDVLIPNGQGGSIGNIFPLICYATGPYSETVGLWPLPNYKRLPRGAGSGCLTKILFDIFNIYTEPKF